MNKHVKHNKENQQTQNNSKIVKLVEDNVIIDARTKIDNYVWVRYGSVIKNCQINYMSFVGFNCRIENSSIGKHCQIASGVNIGSENARPTIIENNVWIGARAFIAPGLTIATGAIIGSGAYVIQNVERDSIVVGRPATKIKKRTYINDSFPEFKKIINMKLNRRPETPFNIPNGEFIKSCYMDVDIKHSNSYEIESNVIMIGRKNSLSPNGGILLGKNTTIQKKCIIEAAGGIEIGDDTIVGEDSLLISNTHDTKYKSLPWKAAKIKIGKNVIIGKGSTIIGPCHINDGSIIMPNSLIIGKNCTNLYSFGIFGQL